MNNKLRSWALTGGILALAVSALWAQKPKSQKEIDALMAVQSAATPDAQIKAIENVLTNFADTEFKLLLLQNAMQLEQQKGDFAQTIFYAERLLDADPKNGFALTTLAMETVRHTREFDLDKEEKLAKVDKWAKAALEGTKTMAKPRADLPDDQWEAVKKDIQANAYEALGMAASARKKPQDAIDDYKSAIATAAHQDPATYVRLAQADMDAGKLDDASAALDKALAIPGIVDVVKKIAEDKKAEIAKRKAAPGGAAAPKPAGI